MKKILVFGPVSCPALVRLTKETGFKSFFIGKNLEGRAGPSDNDQVVDHIGFADHADPVSFGSAPIKQL